MAEFQHINKGALESMFETDLTRNLFQFQNVIIQDLLKKKAKQQACEALTNIGYGTSKVDTFEKHLPRLANATSDEMQLRTPLNVAVRINRA